MSRQFDLAPSDTLMITFSLAHSGIARVKEFRPFEFPLGRLTFHGSEGLICGINPHLPYKL